MLCGHRIRKLLQIFVIMITTVSVINGKYWSNKGPLKIFPKFTNIKDSQETVNTSQMYEAKKYSIILKIYLLQHFENLSLSQNYFKTIRTWISQVCNLKNVAISFFFCIFHIICLSFAIFSINSRLYFIFFSEFI